MPHCTQALATTGLESNVDSSSQRSPQRVTLICFDAPIEIAAELTALSGEKKIGAMLEHPYVLWELILHHLSVFLEEEVWNLTESFSTEQRVGLETNTPLITTVVTITMLGPNEISAGSRISHSATDKVAQRHRLLRAASACRSHHLDS